MTLNEVYDMFPESKWDFTSDYASRSYDRFSNDGIVFHYFDTTDVKNVRELLPYEVAILKLSGAEI